MFGEEIYSLPFFRNDSVEFNVADRGDSAAKTSEMLSLGSCNLVEYRLDPANRKYGLIPWYFLEPIQVNGIYASQNLPDISPRARDWLGEQAMKTESIKSFHELSTP